MEFTEKTVLLNTLVEKKDTIDFSTSKINLSELELKIKMNIIKKNSNLFVKTYDKEKIKEVEEFIKQLEEQLIEVKLAVQHANTNIRHEDGNNNYYYIYRLSALNREIADLTQQLQTGERNLTYLTEKVSKGKGYNHNKKIQENLPSKKVIGEINKDLESRIKDLRNERLEIQTKLSEFNKNTKVIVKVFKPFED